MIKADVSGKNPLVGFFPLTFNLAETGNAILVAKHYMELGGEVVFFSHGGKYEYLIKDFGFDIVKLSPTFTDEVAQEIVSINRGEKKGIPYTESFLREAVREEIAAFKKTDVKMIVSFVTPPCSISARAAKVPLVWFSPVPGNFYLKIPDSYENYFTLLFPQKIKVSIYNFLKNHGRKYLKPFNVVAREYGLKPFRSSMDLFFGDVTLGANYFEFVNVFPNQQILPRENYVGVFSLEELFSDCFSKKEKEFIDNQIQNHFEKSNRSILLAMGSSGDKNLFLRILNALSKTKFKVVAIYTNILDEDNLPDVGDNILLIKFVSSIQQIHRMADLSIIHGGLSTVYSAAYVGTPVIGFPMQFEQHLNLEKMVGHGVGLMLSKKYFKEETLLKAINKIFENHDTYLKNAQALAKKLPKPEGDINAARRIVEILEQTNRTNHL